MLKLCWIGSLYSSLESKSSAFVFLLDGRDFGAICSCLQVSFLYTTVFDVYWLCNADRYAPPPCSFAVTWRGERCVFPGKFQPTGGVCSILTTNSNRDLLLAGHSYGFYNILINVPSFMSNPNQSAQTSRASLVLNKTVTCSAWAICEAVHRYILLWLSLLFFIVLLPPAFTARLISFQHSRVASPLRDDRDDPQQ